MKQKLIFISISLSIWLISSFLLSLILATLYIFSIIPAPYMSFINHLSGILSLIAAGFYLGYKLTNKVFFHALAIAVVFFLLSLPFVSKELISIAILIVKWCCFTFASLFGLSIQK